MSLASQVAAGFTRVGAESKALRTLINGNTTDLSGLTTTTKTSVVAAINEVKAASGGSGGYTVPSGAWWNTVPSASVAQGSVLNHMIVAPIRNPGAFTAQAMQLEVTTAGTVSAVVRLGIYGSDTAGLPDFSNLIADLGTQPAITIGQKTWSGLSLALPAGRLWVAFAAQGSSAAALRRFSNPSVENFSLPVGVTPNTSITQVTMWATVSGAFPTTAPTLSIDGQLQPALSIKAA